MITIKEIDQLIKDPTLVSLNHLEDLKSLAAKYPYSQVFSILYLMGLKSTGDVRFDDELLKHSYRITDRVQLYNLIQGTTFDSPSNEFTEEKVIEEIVEQGVPEPIAETEVFAQETPETVSETEATHETPETEERVEDNEPVSEQPTEDQPSSDALDENIIHHALTMSYQLDELSEEEELELEKRKEEREKEEVSTTPEIKENEVSTDVHEKHSFTSWLKANNNYEEDDDKDRENIKKIVTSFENFDPSDDIFGEVEKPKTEFFSPAKKAKASLDDSAVPVSETLAKIYALQGNYPKAIEAYEQLSLINPEKKIFFANQINELKKKIHNK